MITLHKKRFKHPNPTKTTGRDNPNGGPSVAMMRASNLIAAMESKFPPRLPTESQRRASIEFAMRIAEEKKMEVKDS